MYIATINCGYKFSGLAHNLFLEDTNFGDCNPLYVIFFVQEIVIAHTKFSDLRYVTS